VLVHSARSVNGFSQATWRNGVATREGQELVSGRVTL